MADISKISPDDGSTILNIKDNNAVHWADNAILGAKNLLNTFLPSSTDHGVTFTVNNDGRITANGTATNGNAEFHFINDTNHKYNKYSQFAGKTCIISGCPSGGSSSTYYISLWDNIVGQNVNDYGDGVVYTFPNSEPTAHNIKIRILNGVRVDNITFDPMIRLASDTDGTYASYAMTNKQLTELIKIQTLNNNENDNLENAINNLLTAQNITKITCTDARMYVTGLFTYYSFWFTRNTTTDDINEMIDLSTIFPYTNAIRVGNSIATRDGSTGATQWCDNGSRNIYIRVPKGNGEIIVNGFIFPT